MPFYNFKDIPEELVTPGKSTAMARVITGTQVELAILRFNTGEGAKIHSHPQEQILYMLKGRMKVTSEGQDTVIGPGEAARFAPNVPHGTVMLDDVECVSVKGVIGGLGHGVMAVRSMSDLESDTWEAIARETVSSRSTDTKPSYAG
jgi:quercetin dioxygenase-like cupin family protein